MCVAVIVETKQGPTDSDLYHMHEDNPHGIGVAWAMGDLVRYKKGLTWRQARDLLKTIPRPALLHFRWATHGGMDRAMTHPFPIGRRALSSRKLNGAAQAVLMHNGVWRDYARFAPKGTDLGKWSDTAVAAYAAGEYGEDILDFVDWSTAVGRASGSGRMDVTLRGNWEEYEGNQYSNLMWQPKPKKRVIVTPSGGLEFLESDAWTEYFNRKESIGAMIDGRQVSHSAYDDDPIGLLDDPSDVDFPRWDAEGRLVARGNYATRIAPRDPIESWLKEYESANDACSTLPPVRVRK